MAASATSKSGTRSTDRSGSQIRTPTLRVTAYDRVSSFLMALILAAVGGAIVAVGWWMTTYRPAPPKQELVPLEIVDVTGGYEDGSPDETLRVESPEPENANASNVEAPTDESTPSVEVSIANVMATSGKASQAGDAAPQYADTLDAESSGVPGSASGTGRRPLGMGGGTTGGVRREERWYVKFSDGVSVEEYARQLDYFGIELGVLSPKGTLIYVSRLSTAQPGKREVNSGKDEQRLFFKWQGGERKSADEALLRKAGVDPGGGTIFHFYSQNTENILATLEAQYTRRPLRDVRRTYFNVTRNAKDYSFVVARQTYLR
jgi:hypothetical protein